VQGTSVTAAQDSPPRTLSGPSGAVTPGPGEKPRDLIVIDGSAHWSRWWADLYLYRGAFQSLAWRNLRSRYKQATLGMLWAVLQPAVQVGVFTLVFGILAKVPSEGVPYPLFALAGLLPWNLFARVMADGAVSLVANQGIITKLFFPRIYLVLAAGASAMLDALITLTLLIAAMFYFGVAPGPSILLAFPALLGVLLLSYGLAALLSAINARWRDVQHTLPFLLQIGLFVTPVLYRSTFIPERFQWMVELNPLTGLIEIFRASVLGLPMPDSRVLALSLASSVVMIVLGVWAFRRSEAAIVDVI
jgi:lipopolysaccharide transport system permease protein